MTTAFRGKLLALLCGCVAAGLLLFGVEGIFYALSRAEARRENVVYNPPSRLYEFRLTVGYRPQNDAHVTARKMINGQTIYNVAYTTDNHHRRVTPGQDDRPSGDALFFFGGSFAFGEGLNDNETLPYYVAMDAPAYRVYNYGFSGYGPQQAVAQLRDDSLFGPEGKRQAIGIYVFIPHHIRRAIGSMRVVSEWGYHFPDYEEDGRGGVVLNQTFERGRPWRTWIYRLMAREQVWRYFKVDWPLSISHGDIVHTAHILAAAQKAFEQRFHGGVFYVLMYPEEGHAEVKAFRTVPVFRAAGLRILDASKTVDLSQPGMTIRGDNHPTAEANRLLAGHIVKVLNLRAPGPPVSGGTALRP